MSRTKLEDPDQIVEEYEANKATDIELEESDTAGNSHDRPYDPAAIRVDPKTFSLRQIIDMIDDGDLDLAPDFQRNQVWKAKAKSRLIESILLRIPLPAFYFSADGDGRLRVVDGLQRLSTVHSFVRGGPDKKGAFELNDLEYLDKGVTGLRFGDLDATWTRRIHQTQIFVNVIDPQTPVQVKFDIFKRLNTGGTPLNAQEIRHCMSKPRSREFLKACAAAYQYFYNEETPLSFEDYQSEHKGALSAAIYKKANLASESFGHATGWAMYNQVRMVDREVILRFCAFRLAGEALEGYGPSTVMDRFLIDATTTIDSELNDRKLATLAGDLDQAMQNASELFGEHAFRKWPLGDDRKKPINRALFESWAVALADYTWKDLSPHKAKIIKAVRVKMVSDNDYMNAVSSGTGDHGRVKLRFETARQILAKAVG